MPDPDDKQAPTDDQAPDGEAPPAEDAPDPESIEWDTWLKEQPEAVRQAFEGHVGGLKNALTSERDKRKGLESAERARKKEADKAEQDALAEQGEFKAMAEKAQARVTELEAEVTQIETLTEERDKYREAVATFAKEARDGIPDYVSELLDTMDPVAQLEYLTKHSKELRGSSKGLGGPGNSPGHGGTTKMTPEEQRKAAYQPRF